MKFLLIAPRFHTNLYYRIVALQNAGHQVKILVLYKGQSEYYQNIEIEQIGFSLLSKLISKTLRLFKKNHLKTGLELRLEFPNKELKKHIKDYQPDVILLKAYQNMLAISTLFWAKRFNVKVLMLTQTPFAHIKGSKLLFQFNIWCFKKMGVHAYITPIKINYDKFQKFGIKNVHYLPFVFPVPDNTLENIKNNQNEEFKIISVGKFVKRKDQLLLLQAISNLKDKYPIQLTLIGEIADQKYYNEILDKINELQLQNIVEVKTNVSYPDMQKEYTKHHIFILPSYGEPAAYSIVEAMANGLAVICSSQNGTQSYIQEGENGYIFKAKSLADLTQKLELLLLDKKKLFEMQKNALSLATIKHDLSGFCEKVDDMILN
jgi:glycosyltransferase involved in cell wall biosynthesis